MAGNSPLVSEFETDEQEQDYTLWLSAKVQAAIANPHPPIAHPSYAVLYRVTTSRVEIVAITHTSRLFP